MCIRDRPRTADLRMIADPQSVCDHIYRDRVDSVRAGASRTSAPTVRALVALPPSAFVVKSLPGAHRSF
jgi:hypothetical protein